MEHIHSSSEIIDKIREQFPDFADCITRWNSRLPFTFCEPMPENEITGIETDYGVRLPGSYKRFLRLNSSLETRNGAVRLGHMHFIHENGPGKDMLCIGDFNMLADGDQILLDTTREPVNDEYTVYYYDHEASPASITKLADTFPQFLGEFMDYEDWGEYEEDAAYEPAARTIPWLVRVASGFASTLCLFMLMMCLIAMSRGFNWHWKTVLTIVLMPTVLAGMSFCFGVIAITGNEPEHLYERWKYRSPKIEDDTK